MPGSRCHRGRRAGSTAGCAGSVPGGGPIAAPGSHACWGSPPAPSAAALARPGHDARPSRGHTRHLLQARFATEGGALRGPRPDSATRAGTRAPHGRLSSEPDPGVSVHGQWDRGPGLARKSRTPCYAGTSQSGAQARASATGATPPARGPPRPPPPRAPAPGTLRPTRGRGPANQQQVSGRWGWGPRESTSGSRRRSAKWPSSRWACCPAAQPGFVPGLRVPTGPAPAPGALGSIEM